MKIKIIAASLLALALTCAISASQTLGTREPEQVQAKGEIKTSKTYVLGSGDQVVIRSLLVEEISDKPVRVDMDGNINLPMIGDVKVGGLSVHAAEAILRERLSKYVRSPEIAISITEYRSQPVSVIGSVRTPGVHQLLGRKSLIEILSLAGGLADDAGYSIKITRLAEWGSIPVDTAKWDESGQYSIAEVKLRSIIQATDPGLNLQICPHDVISVPRGELVYVIGQVKRSGGVVLRDRESLSVVSALAVAEGTLPTASAKNAKILRLARDGKNRVEIPVNLSKVLSGEHEDLLMKPEDVLFVPGSASKAAALRAAEVAIQLGTGMLIWRR